MSINMQDDIESAIWDNTDPARIYYTDEKGNFFGYDVRNINKGALFSVDHFN